MRRRSLLAALTAGLGGLAGCQGIGGGRRRTTFGVPPRDTEDGSNTDEGTPPTTTPPGPEPPPGVEPRVDPEPPGRPRRAVETRLGPKRRLVLWPPVVRNTSAFSRVTAGFVRPPTPEAPARVWVAFENVGEERRTYTFGPTPPFSNYLAGSPGRMRPAPRYMLVPDDDRPFPYRDPTPRAPTDGQWVAKWGLEAGEDRSDDPGLEEHTVALDPGEAVTGRYVLLVYPGANGRPRRSVRRFEGYRGDVSLGLSTLAPDVAVPGESRFRADREVPGLPGGERTRWFHRVAGNAAPATVFLRPDHERLRVGDDRTRLVLENLSVRTVRAPSWRLYKLHDGTWKYVAPREFTFGLGAVPPGDASRVLFAPYRSFPIEAPESDQGGLTRVGGLGPGTYALRFGQFRVPPPDPDSPVRIVNDEGYHDTGEETPPGKARPDPVVAAALLELSGEPLEVSYTDDVRRVERETGREGLTVRVGKPPAGDDEPPRLVVRRKAAPPADATTLVTEQVVRFPALRNALAALAEGVDVVRVVTEAADARRPIQQLGEGRRLPFVHEGTAAVATAEDTLEVTDQG